MMCLRDAKRKKKPNLNKIFLLSKTVEEDVLPSKRCKPDIVSESRSFSATSLQEASDTTQN